MRRRPFTVAVAFCVALAAFVGSTGVATAAQTIEPHEHFKGVVNGHTKHVIVDTVCPGPATPGRTGPVAGGQTLSVERHRRATGDTGPFSQVYAWFVQDSSATTPAAVTFRSYGVEHKIPNKVRVPCDGQGQVQFSSCPYHAPCAAGFVADVVEVTFVNIAA